MPKLYAEYHFMLTRFLNYEYVKHYTIIITYSYSIYTLYNKTYFWEKILAISYKIPHKWFSLLFENISKLYLHNFYNTCTILIHTKFKYRQKFIQKTTIVNYFVISYSKNITRRQNLMHYCLPSTAKFIQYIM